MTNVPVNPDVLVWAREERGLTLEGASKRLNLPIEEIAALESGKREPTLGELERFATHYKIPLVSLLMPNRLALITRPKLDDFRAFEGQHPKELSHETILAIEETAEIMEGLVDLGAADSLYRGVQVPPMYQLSERPEAIAAEERERLGISVAEQLAWSGDREAFLRWREVVESQGVYAYQLKLGADGTRGFAIWDHREIPIVVIDSSEEGYQAKIFMIWHEYAHILLRMGGISDQNYGNNVERYCNSFAAFFLMPRDEFKIEARQTQQGAIAWNDAHVTSLANRFKVSKSAVAIHLETTGLAHAGFYREMLEEWRFRKPHAASGRATPAEKYANRLGNRYIETVFSAVDRGVITALDAYEFTRVKPKHFQALQREVAQRRAAYGRPS